jgi:hypothetical protein
VTARSVYRRLVWIVVYAVTFLALRAIASRLSGPRWFYARNSWGAWGRDIDAGLPRGSFPADVGYGILVEGELVLPSDPAWADLHALLYPPAEPRSDLVH